MVVLGLVGSCLAARSARADGVAQVFASKSIPPATVALIDPESGTSSGGGTTDVRVAPGDVVLFRFKYFPVAPAPTTRTSSSSARVKTAWQRRRRQDRLPDDPGCNAGIDGDEVDAPVDASDTRPRLLLAFDTSGSMNWNTCADVLTGGDGSGECAGSDVACAACNASGCGEGQPNDACLSKVKAGVTDAVRAFGEVDWALMRFHQRSSAFSCASANAVSGRKRAEAASIPCAAARTTTFWTAPTLWSRAMRSGSPTPGSAAARTRRPDSPGAQKA